MKRTTKYVALDVHQASTVASVREEGGRVIARSVLPTDGIAVTEFIRGMRGAVHVTFEDGTQAQWLHDLLVPLVDRVVVCDRRGAPRQGTKVDQVRERAQWLAQLGDRGARFRAEVLYAELDRLRTRHPTVKAAMLAEARQDPAWAVLRSIPYLGPVRVALLLATIGTPWRFRSKRHLWAYAGLAVVTHSSADYTVSGGQVSRRRRAPGRCRSSTGT